MSIDITRLVLIIFLLNLNHWGALVGRMGANELGLACASVRVFAFL